MILQTNVYKNKLNTDKEEKINAVINMINTVQF